MQSRRAFLKSLSITACSTFLSSSILNAKPEQKNRPNIIMIMADDLGYGDLGFFGNDIVKTPNLDKLASESIVLTQHYAGGPVCMPTRVCFVTGKYPYRTGARMTKEGKEPSLKDNIFFPALLRDAGYATTAIGKWHMGNFNSKGIKTMGFDEWAICAPGGWCDFYDYTMHKNTENYPSESRYSTDVLTEEALDFIDRHKNDPFFLYLAYTAPHFPLQAPEEEIEPYKNKGLTEGAEIVYAMITRMDKKIGEIIKDLKKKGLYDNSILVFSSDNGPRFGAYKDMDQTRFNHHLAGEKGLTTEGGIRIPAFIHWPEKFGKQSGTCSEVMHMADWFPTFINAAGIKMPKNIDIDGYNFIPVLQGKKSVSNFTRFWTYNKTRPTVKSNGAMRQGPWKLHRPTIKEFNSWDTPADFPMPEEVPDYQLFRIDTDPFEKHDLSDQFPEKLKEMKIKYEAWFERTMKEHEAINKLENKN